MEIIAKLCTLIYAHVNIFGLPALLLFWDGYYAAVNGLFYIILSAFLVLAVFDCFRRLYFFLGTCGFTVVSAWRDS